MRGTSVTACGRLLVALVIALGFSSLPAQAGTKFKLVPSEDEVNFGVGVALDGDTVVVAAEGPGSVVKPHAGAVYVFVKSQAGWVQQAKLTGDPNVPYFGYSISISGDNLIVSAGGHAYVFHRSGMTWSKQATLFPTKKPHPEQALFDAPEVAISGDYAVVAPIGGEAHVYHRSGAVWSKQAELSLTNCVSVTKIAIDGDYILVGCLLAPARVFRRFGGLWLFQATLTGSEDGVFGTSVSLRGNRAIIGAPFDSQVGGAVYIFAKNGPTWTSTKFNAPSPVDVSGKAFGYEDFGRSVSISSSYALAGRESAGSAILYRRNGSSWSLSEVLASGVPNDHFGRDVAVSDTRAVVGAPAPEWLIGLPHQGAAYVFEDLVDLRARLSGLLNDNAVPVILVGCEIVDCCPGCPGPPYEIDWRIRVSGPVLEAVNLWFPTLPPDAARRMNVEGNGRWLGLNRLRVDRGQTMLRSFSVKPGVRAPVAIPQLVLDEAAVRSLTSARGGKEVGRVELIVEQMIGRVVVGEYRFDYDFDEGLRSRRPSAPKP
jgi:FG-GAP repeat